MKRLCKDCGKRPARFRTNKDRRFRADKHHDLCSQCSRTYADRFRPCAVKP